MKKIRFLSRLRIIRQKPTKIAVHTEMLTQACHIGSYVNPMPATCPPSASGHRTSIMAPYIGVNRPISSNAPVNGMNMLAANARITIEPVAMPTVFSFGIARVHAKP